MNAMFDTLDVAPSWRDRWVVLNRCSCQAVLPERTTAMLNPSNGDPGQVVVNYVEEYLELVESLPCDLQRSVSLMKEIDAKYQGK